MNKTFHITLYINGIKYQKEKLITLIIPTYDNDEKLKMMLKSLEKIGIFHDENIEVLIIQNHFDIQKFQNTQKLEKKYAIKVYHEPRQGKACALNYGIKKAQGKFIVSTDDDVIITDKNWLYKFVEEFDKNPRLGYCSGKVSMYKETSNEYSQLWEKKGGLSK